MLQVILLMPYCNNVRFEWKTTAPKKIIILYIICIHQQSNYLCFHYLSKKNRTGRYINNNHTYWSLCIDIKGQPVNVPLTALIYVIAPTVSKRVDVCVCVRVYELHLKYLLILFLAHLTATGERTHDTKF